MKGMRIPWQSWVLVCDGSKALVLRNDGDAELLNLTIVDTMSEPHPPARELGTDRPGRVYQSHGSARSAVSENDRHAQSEVAFLSGVAERLDQLVRHHAVKSLILVAPPKALGIVRERLTPAVRGTVVVEIAKDLVWLSTNEIEKHLAA